MKNKIILFFAISLCTGNFGCNGDDTGQTGIRPVIYFHGGFGSASQFQTQAQRFASNGYPENHLAVFEYNTAEAVPDKDAMNARIDDFIDRLLDKTGADQVDIMGKTWPGAYPDGIPGLTMEYMTSSPERAAKIAHAYYADTALSGYTAIVPTMAVWADTPAWDTSSAIIGATNITLPLHSHVQTCTSAESFLHAYRFFNEKDPATTEILPESNSHGRITLAGRSILMQSNLGVSDATVEIYEVNGDTGIRIHRRPEAIYALGEDKNGEWGPFSARAGQHYEFVIVRDGQNHHFYYEPFIRSDYFIRLITAEIGGLFNLLMDQRDEQTNLNILRDKEFWGDQGVNNDLLLINGINIINNNTCPADKRANAIFIYDFLADNQSNINGQILFFWIIPFMSGIDLFMPAADPPDKTINLELMPRGSDGGKQVLNVPNWPSSTGMITVHFNDFYQETSL